MRTRVGRSGMQSASHHCQRTKNELPAQTEPCSHVCPGVRFPSGQELFMKSLAILSLIVIAALLACAQSNRYDPSAGQSVPGSQSNGGASGSQPNGGAGGGVMPGASGGGGQASDAPVTTGQGGNPGLFTCTAGSPCQIPGKPCLVGATACEGGKASCTETTQ